MLLLARALAAAACLLPLAVPAAAHGALNLSHVTADAVERAGNGDDVVTPGDDIRITERIGTVSALADATGTLFTPTPGVSISANTSRYADAAAGGQSVNARPFEATLDALMSCGANMNFTLAVDATGGQDSVSFTVPTGARGPLVEHAGTAQALADNAATSVALQVATLGRVKAMEVAIDGLTHPSLADLRIELVAPDGNTTLLVPENTLTGANIASLVLADGAVPISGDRTSTR